MTGKFPLTWRILLLAAAVVFLAHAVRYYGYLLDDAFISLRYARNLVAGEGLVFNPGELVEGYSNFLWVLIGALALAAGGDGMTAWQWLSVAATAGLLVTAWRLERLGSGAPILPAVVWLLPLESLAYWSSTGMETTFFAALFAAAVLVALREAVAPPGGGTRFPVSAVLFVFVALTRSDGVVCFVLGLVAAAVVGRLHHGGWPARRLALQSGVFGLLYGTYFAWRWRYYGELIPNPAHAKMTWGPEQWLNGLLNLGQWAAAHPAFAFALGAPAVLLVGRRRQDLRAPPEHLGLWLIALGWIAYVVAVGGDFMPFFRFFVPVLPLGAVLLSRTLGLLATPGSEGRLRRLAVVLLLGQVAANHLVHEQSERAFVADRTTVVGQEVGRYLGANVEPGELIAVNTAGAVPYESGLPAVDMLGLADYAIARHPVYVVSPRWAAHRRGWGEYVLSRRPRVVVWYNTAGLREPHYLGDHQLADNPYFRFFYQLRQATLPMTERSDRVLARFLGAPFGDEAPSASSPNLGVRFELRQRPVRHTAVFPAQITLHYFELRRDRERFWPQMAASGGDVGRFLEAVVAAWRSDVPTADPAARREVEELCRRALVRVEQGDTATAKVLLTRAAERNAAARSPLVYQYVANLAVMEKDLFLAVHAQEEALRLAPVSALYRRNLHHLLVVPFKEFKETSRPRS